MDFDTLFRAVMAAYASQRLSEWNRYTLGDPETPLAETVQGAMSAAASLLGAGVIGSFFSDSGHPSGNTHVIYSAAMASAIVGQGIGRRRRLFEAEKEEYEGIEAEAGNIVTHQQTMGLREFESWKDDFFERVKSRSEKRAKTLECRLQRHVEELESCYGSLNKVRVSGEATATPAVWRPGRDGLLYILDGDSLTYLLIRRQLADMCVEGLGPVVYTPLEIIDEFTEPWNGDIAALSKHLLNQGVLVVAAGGRGTPEDRKAVGLAEYLRATSYNLFRLEGGAERLLKLNQGTWHKR